MDNIKKYNRYTDESNELCKAYGILHNTHPNVFLLPNTGSEDIPNKWKRRYVNNKGCPCIIGTPSHSAKTHSWASKVITLTVLIQAEKTNKVQIKKIIG